MTTVLNIRTSPRLVAQSKARGRYVYVGRGSKWGNRFTHLNGRTKAQVRVSSRDEACDRYEKEFWMRPELYGSLPELFDKDLGCYCYPQRCHGDFLAAKANELQRDIVTGAGPVFSLKAWVLHHRGEA
jgi:hypothetical protein